jgi:predicted DNA-binding transcriptional regulator YafY
MRADRLLKMTMILQTGGRKTAQDLADELEVSERTIYRDVIALSAAGVPVYTEKGPGGGIQLIEEYRTSLTGLSPDEVRALFMINIPAALASLGMGDEVQTAWLKLSASLPDYLKQSQRDTRQRMLIDQSWWKNRPDEAPSFLKDLYRAVWGDRQIRITIGYQFGFQTEHLVEPYSLVSRGQNWFLVCCNEGNLKVFWLRDIHHLEVMDETFSRPKGFDLESFWADWMALQESLGLDYKVELLAREEALKILKRRATAVLDAVERTEDPEWQRVLIRFDGFPEARRQILDLGGAVKVLDPIPFARTIEDYAQQIIARYED